MRNMREDSTGRTVKSIRRCVFCRHQDVRFPRSQKDSNHRRHQGHLHWRCCGARAEDAEVDVAAVAAEVLAGAAVDSGSAAGVRTARQSICTKMVRAATSHTFPERDVDAACLKFEFGTVADRVAGVGAGAGFAETAAAV